MNKELKKEYKKQRQIMHEEYLKEAIQKSRFNEEEKEILFNLLSFMKYGVNRIKEILVNIWEISRRDQMGVSDVLNKINVEEIIKNDETSLKSKAEDIRNAILKMRFPKVAEYKDKWNEKVKMLNLPKGMEVNPPFNFEGDKITIKMDIKDKEDYIKYKDKIADMEPHIGGLLNLLQE